ncbi:hypothetical protein ANCCAN_03717, partial [Ancylostoma caninum]
LFLFRTVWLWCDIYQNTKKPSCVSIKRRLIPLCCRSAKASCFFRKMRNVLLVALCVGLHYADGRMCTWDTDTFFEGYMQDAPTVLRKHIERDLSLEFKEKDIMVKFEVDEPNGEKYVYAVAGGLHNDAVYAVMIKKSGNKLAGTKSISMMKLINKLVTCPAMGEVPTIERLQELIK